MSKVSPQNEPVAVLTLHVDSRENPDWPVVRILINGEDPLEQAAPGWLGFDPDEILGSKSPLLPLEGMRRRVAVYRCSCGEAGCGVIAPTITRSQYFPRIHWTDFRNYAGVFFRPVPSDDDDGAAEDFGRPWPLPDLAFDVGQYTAEIERASLNRSWETPRRQTARLLEERLRPLNLALPTGLPLQRVIPAWEQDGYIARFERAHDDGTIDQTDIELPEQRGTPHDAAAALATRLLAVPVRGWHASF